jgi:hypothetical protein
VWGRIKEPTHRPCDGRLVSIVYIQEGEPLQSGDLARPYFDAHQHEPVSPPLAIGSTPFASPFSSCLNVTVEEIKAALLHATTYCGIPAGLDAFRAAHEVLVGEVR